MAEPETQEEGKSIPRLGHVYWMLAEFRTVHGIRFPDPPHPGQIQIRNGGTFWVAHANLVYGDGEVLHRARSYSWESHSHVIYPTYEKAMIQFFVDYGRALVELSVAQERLGNAVNERCEYLDKMMKEYNEKQGKEER